MEDIKRLLVFHRKVVRFIANRTGDRDIDVARLGAVIAWDPLLSRSLARSARAVRLELWGDGRDVELAIAYLGTDLIKRSVAMAIAEGVLEPPEECAAWRGGSTPRPPAAPETQKRRIRKQVQALMTTLVDAFDCLQDRDRLLLALHYYEGLSMRSIAHVLDTTESKAQAMHDDAMNRLRKVMNDYCQK